MDQGADLRYVQELPGHDSIETTVHYTRQIDQQVRQACKSHHPRENEYFREITPEYRGRLEALKRELIGLPCNRSIIDPNNRKR